MAICSPANSPAPGSKVTGLAIVQDSEVVWAANLEHRGNEIKKDLKSRAAVRRS
ncbi:MAG: RRXRR domain-containing protein, partial [Tolypothrix carrinoi HA7290-LM1]|nr:RRXRR domain-containing protein [Tolypothrix carrinoi HA7290-LM1]